MSLMSLNQPITIEEKVAHLMIKNLD